MHVVFFKFFFTMSLNENQILSFLADGTVSDLDNILSSESENELEDLLNQFSNDDFSAELDNYLQEEDDQTVITTDETQ